VKKQARGKRSGASHAGAPADRLLRLGADRHGCAVLASQWALPRPNHVTPALFGAGIVLLSSKCTPPSHTHNLTPSPHPPREAVVPHRQPVRRIHQQVREQPRHVVPQQPQRRHLLRAIEQGGCVTPHARRALSGVLLRAQGCPKAARCYLAQEPQTCTLGAHLEVCPQQMGAGLGVVVLQQQLQRSGKAGAWRAGWIRSARGKEDRKRAERSITGAAFGV
jgi:hypothetical protein